MRYFKLTIAYDGTDFHGWQIQKGKPTVQGEIVSVLRRVDAARDAVAGRGPDRMRGCTRWGKWAAFVRNRRFRAWSFIGR